MTDDSFSRRGLELSLKPRQWVPLIQCLPKSASCKGTSRKSFAFKYLGYLVQDGSVGLQALHWIEATAFAFHRLQRLWLDRHVKGDAALRVS